MREMFKSIFAGILIGIGGLVFLNMENKIIGSFLFSIGLITILVMKLNLFTGKVCYLKNYKIFQLIGVFIGNYIGAIITAYITVNMSNKAPVQKALEITQAKLAKSPPELLVDGLICCMCIGIAVKGYELAEGIGKYLLVVLGVMVFILVGSEHVVANMYYSTIPIYTKSISIGSVLPFILLNGLGNLLGGVLIVGLSAGIGIESLEVRKHG